jgi:hypothetical protein
MLAVTNRRLLKPNEQTGSLWNAECSMSWCCLTSLHLAQSLFNPATLGFNNSGSALRSRR